MDRTVQELLTASSEEGDPEALLGRFIHKGEGGDAREAAAAAGAEDVPVIDLSLLHLSPSSEAATAAASELQRFRAALTSWGCFQAVNHGMDVSFLDEVREVTKAFFELPSGEKRRYLRSDNDIEGYGTDMVLSDQQVLDWNDRIYLSVYPEDRRRLEYWPEKPESFRKVLHDYTLKLREMVDIIFKAMALSLDLDSSAFLEKLGGKVSLFARFNYYPPCPRPELIYGLKPHADGSAITIVLPDKEVEGLQFLKDDRWVQVPILPHAVLVNVGDQVEIMSNGAFKSPMHRAIPNSEHDRISLAMFCTPDAETEIEPLSELIDESRPGLYKNVKNYPEIYFHHYQQGKRPIDAVKL